MEGLPRHPAGIRVLNGQRGETIPVGPLLNRRGRGQRHAMTAEDVHHFRAIGRAAGGGGDYFGGFSEVRGTHERRGDHGELFRILVAEVIEAVQEVYGDLRMKELSTVSYYVACFHVAGSYFLQAQGKTGKGVERFRPGPKDQFALQHKSG
jgi:hypothetical protein